MDGHSSVAAVAGGGRAIVGPTIKGAAWWCLWLCGGAAVVNYVNWQNADGSYTSVEVEDPSTADSNNDGRITKVELKEKRKEFDSKTKKAYWKREAEERKYAGALKNGGKYTAENIERMKAGKPPIGSDGKPVELHHKKPLSQGGTNSFSNLKPTTRTQHRGAGNYCKSHPTLCKKNG